MTLVADPPLTLVGDTEKPVSLFESKVHDPDPVPAGLVAVMVTTRRDGTPVCFSVNEAVSDPVCTSVVRVARVRAGSLELRVNVMPGFAAGKESLIRPITDRPSPETKIWGRMKTSTVAGETVNGADTCTSPSDAPMFTVVFAATSFVVTLNEASLAPAATVTVAVAGKATAVLSEVSVIFAPPVGAGPLSFTVARAVDEPKMVVGLTVIPVRTAGLTVRTAVNFAVSRVAVIVASTDLATAVVVIGKVTTDTPAPSVTLAGTETAALLDDNVTVASFVLSRVVRV